MFVSLNLLVSKVDKMRPILCQPTMYIAYTCSMEDYHVVPAKETGTQLLVKVNKIPVLNSFQIQLVIANTTSNACSITSAAATLAKSTATIFTFFSAHFIPDK